MNKRWGQFTKKQVIDAYNLELNMANVRLVTLNRQLVGYKLGVIQPPEPTSLKMALEIASEIKKISKVNIKIKDGKIVDIDNPSKYLRVQEILEKKIKGRKFKKEYKIFTAEEASSILKEQIRVNKKRKRNQLPPISGLRFDKEKRYQDIKKEVKFKGSDIGIGTEKDRLVKGIITSLNSAYQKLVDTGDTMGDEFIFIKELINEINSDPNAYSKLRPIVAGLNNKDFIFMYSSDAIVFNPSPELYKIMDAYNISTKDYYDAINNIDEVNF